MNGSYSADKHLIQNFYGHIRRYSASVTLSVVFGIHCSTYDNPLMVEFFECQRKWEHILRPGGHPPVDVFPFLKYIPERWASWKGLCREVRSRQRKYYFSLLQSCHERIKSDKRNNSFMEYLLENQKKYNFDEESTWCVLTDVCLLSLILLQLLRPLVDGRRGGYHRHVLAILRLVHACQPRSQIESSRRDR